MLLGATAIVFNRNPTLAKNECIGSYDGYYPESYYRCRNCDTNMNSQNPATKYQIQKIIQNTVRAASSLYTMNVGSLSSFQKDTLETANVPWNQMSDRAVSHKQPNMVASGSQYGGNSTKRTITRLRPGALSPGGSGVDIKHNSYDRMLNRLKGRKILRQDYVPKNYGAIIPFNPALPIYGNKTIKTGIVSGCNCPTENVNDGVEPTVFPSDIYSVVYNYSVGDKVYVLQSNCRFLEGEILSINASNDLYLIKLTTGKESYYNSLQIIPYFSCNCTSSDISYYQILT